MIFFHQTVSVPTHEQTERHISINKHVSFIIVACFIGTRCWIL